jgi:hypothetical protein
MPRTIIERLVEARLRMLEREVPGTVRDHDVIAEDGIVRAVITIADAGGRPLYVEFLESGDSLLRPMAVDQFNQATMSGVRALVIVPDDAHHAAAALLSRAANPSVELVSYGVVGISLMA